MDDKYLNYLEEKKLWLIMIFILLNLGWIVSTVIVLSVIESPTRIVVFPLLALSGLIINYLVFQGIYERGLLERYVQDHDHNEEM